MIFNRVIKHRTCSIGVKQFFIRVGLFFKETFQTCPLSLHSLSSYNISSFLPCPFKTWAIMTLHKLLYLCTSIHINASSAKHLHKLGGLTYSLLTLGSSTHTGVFKKLNPWEIKPREIWRRTSWSERLLSKPLGQGPISDNSNIVCICEKNCGFG